MYPAHNAVDTIRIEAVKERGARFLALAETHLSGTQETDVADYIGTRLGWQSMRKGQAGGAPEYR